MSEEIYKLLGDKIRSSRKSIGLTQDELGKKIGFSRTSITNIEQGRQMIQIHTLYKIADTLNTDPRLLLPLLHEINQETNTELLSQAEQTWLSTIMKKTQE